MRNGSDRSELLQKFLCNGKRGEWVVKFSSDINTDLDKTSAEEHLFRRIVDEAADGIYVIDKSNYELLFVNESRKCFAGCENYTGQKCYAALHKKSAPCAFCTLKDHLPDGREHPMQVEVGERIYSTWFHDMDWNGIPAYVKFVRDVTEDVRVRREKKRLEEYFQMLVKRMPGGVAVLQYNSNGVITPEYLSNGFFDMTGMPLEDSGRLYRQDISDCIHPEDQAFVLSQMKACFFGSAVQNEVVCRLKRSCGDYLWVKCAMTLIRDAGNETRLYAVFRDITKELEEQERLRYQYKELILSHYSITGPGVLILAHCNITKRRILEVNDHTASGLLEAFGNERDSFFTGIAGFIVKPQERRTFLDTYLSAPALEAFAAGETEKVFECFVKLPGEALGRYVRIDMNMVVTPDSGDITGILTITDVTRRAISDRIQRRLFTTGYEFIVDLDLIHDSYEVLSQYEKASCVPPMRGCHSKWMAHVLESVVLPRDRETYRQGLTPERILERLQHEDSYTFTFCVSDENGGIHTKNMVVSAIDLRLGRVSLVRTDITDSVREQQGLLNAIAYTFDLMGFIDISSGRLTMYTRRSVLDNLPPEVTDDYGLWICRFAGACESERSRKKIENKFRLDNILKKLSEKTSGYDFVLPCETEDGLRYKQINVLWGDENHQTICLVRADVTDMLAAERKSKQALKAALYSAEKANAAKRDFLSSMSHDIRTPMNAIMGMTEIARAHICERERVADCLEKISVSSRYLLSLINDILDMSKIEQSKVTLNNTAVSISDLKEQLCVMMAPQAKSAGIGFAVRTGKLSCNYFYGDALRINQILINLTSNAIKFTPEGGRVDVMIEELAPASAGNVRYRFTVSDTGIGMTEEFMAHAFEPFMRERGVSRVVGTGLGLSITRGLVDFMGGTVTIESQVNKGSTFRVELEFAPAPVPAGIGGYTGDGPGLPKAGEGALAGRYFLVAEDNAINAEIICELLKMNGAGTAVETDGVRVVKAFAESDPGTYDAVLMDIQMPGMNGYEATRAIRKMERPDAVRIPIIAMTANAFDEDVQTALEAGMNAHVAKPIDMDTLLAVLYKVLRTAGS